MIRRISVLFTMTLVTSLFAGVLPEEVRATADDVASQISVSSVTLQTSPCPVENDCLLVKWNMPLQLKPSPGTGFLLTGRLTCDSGQLNAPDITLNDGSVRSHQFNFFHTCSGGVKSADVSVSFFRRGNDNEVVVASTASKTQTFP